jgi:pentatricopeptide repeat protein
MTQPANAMDANQLAEAVRAACLQAAVSAHEDAGIRGLCEAGRWEAALGALQSLDLRGLIEGLVPRPDGEAGLQASASKRSRQ